uniref:Sm domain-containing protein n=1 Tax=Romanomermis culicivorax TaxID=13658 RepID=A0A915HZL7_ROMCU
MPSTCKERIQSSRSLVCLLQNLRGRRTVVELRGEKHIVGVLNDVDASMNLEMVEVQILNCCRHSSNVSTIKFDRFFVASRQICYVHIPSDVDVIKTLEKSLTHLFAKPKRFDQRKTRREKLNEIIEKKLQILAAAKMTEKTKN